MSSDPLKGGKITNEDGDPERQPHRKPPARTPGDITRVRIGSKTPMKPRPTTRKLPGTDDAGKVRLGALKPPLWEADD